MKIFVINLKKDIDRKNSILRQFKDQNINFEFFDAINSNEIHKKGFQNFSTSTQIAIFTSHRNIWKNNIDRDYFLICEDDIIIPNNFIEKINFELNKLKKEKWDIITFSNPINIYPLNKFVTACCYLIKGSYAKKLLNLKANGHVDLKINYNKGNIFYIDIGLKVGAFVSNNTNMKLNNKIIWILNMPLFNIPLINIKISLLYLIAINLLLFYYKKNVNYNIFINFVFIIIYNLVNC